MSRVLSLWSSPRVILPISCAIGLLVRLVPCLHDPGFRLVSDAAYHERLVAETIAAGRLPAIDRLSNAPEGRRTARELPVGLYVISALKQRALFALGLRDARWSLALLVASWGGLIAIPVWFATRAVFGSRAAASCAALCSVLLPAHLQRTYGYWFRYDALGTLFLATHAALALAALTSTRPVRRGALALASAVFFVAAMWVWRVSFIVLGIELAFVAFRLATRGAEPALRDLWVAIALVGSAGVALIDYLNVRSFLLSPLWFAVIGLAVALCLPWLRPTSRAALRLATIALIAAFAAGIGHAHVPTGYAGLTALVPAKLGLIHGHDPVAVLMTEVEELTGISPWTLATEPQELFVLGAWLIASPVLFWWLAGRPRLAHWSAMEPAPMLLVFLCAGLVACVLLFERASALLAPFAAMTLGGLGARLVAASAAAPAPAPARRPPRARNTPRVRRWLAGALAASAVATCVAGVVQAFTSGSSMAPGEELAIRFLREHTPEQAVILAFWDEGYDIQTFAGRATVMDGLLESDENRRRIFEFDRALMAATPDSLDHLCARYGATWFVVPPLQYIYDPAAVAGDPIAERIAHDQPLRVGVDTERVIYHLMTGDAPVPGFRLAYSMADFRVYEYAPR